MDGTGRKLMLYDKTRQAITVIGEIQKATANHLLRRLSLDPFLRTGTLRILPQPIDVTRIRQLEGFKFFGKCQNACWNVTQQEYRLLTGQAE